MENSPKVLYIEDNTDNRMLVRRVLEAEGYNVLEAASAQEALDVLEVQTPDLIFMDINMPQLDGFQATQIIKREQKGTNIVVLSMHSDQQEAAFKSGADEFIAKGSDAQIIKQVVLRFFTEHLKENRS